MAQPRHIKLKIADSKNIYYVDSLGKYNSFKELTDKDIPNKQPQDFRLSLKVSPLVNGKQKIVKKTFKFSKLETLKSAIRFVADKRLELFESVKNGKYATKTKQEHIPTLREVGALYWESKHLAPKTSNMLQLYAKKWLGGGHAREQIAEGRSVKVINILDKLPQDVTTADIQAIVDFIISEDRKPSTAVYVKSCLNPVFKQLISEGKIFRNPLYEVKIPKFDNTTYIHISDEGVKALMQEIYAYEVEPFRTIFMWLTRGRRLNEVLSIKYEDIDFQTMTYEVKAENNKVRKHMQYGLSQELVDSIEGLNYHIELGVSVPLAERRGMVFTAPLAGGKMSGRSVWYHWKKITKLCEVSKTNNTDDFAALRVHDIRHIIGNTLVSNGKTLEEVAAVLGHTSTAITQRYSKVRRTVSDNALDDFMSIVRPDEDEED